MKRCSWCQRIIWPWPIQQQSAGNTMHARCAQYVDRITTETEAQYTAWTPDEAYEQFLMRIDQEKDL